MNHTYQWILRSCAILCALLTSSCLDVHEEFWLHKDGSAEAKITCHMPRTATLALGGPKGVKLMAEAILADEESIDSYEVEVIEEQKRVVLKVHCKVDELLAFDRLRQSIQVQKDLHPAVRKLVGEFNIGIDGLFGVSVTRTVAPGEAIPALLWLPKSQIKGHSFVKIMHFPRPISNHNAHKHCDNGRTLSWETSLASAIQAPMMYQFVMPIPLPWGWIIAGTVGLIAVFMLTLKLLKARSRRASRES